MKRVRCKVAVIAGARGVDLPSKIIDWDTYDKRTNSVECLVPDEYMVDGQLDEQSIRHMYRGQPDIDNPGLGNRLEGARPNGVQRQIPGGE